MMVPILDAVRAINRHGMEVVSGIILGLDTDTPDSGARILEFLERSQNSHGDDQSVAGAAAHAALGPAAARRPAARATICERESNVDFKLPYDEVLAMWRNCMARAYEPESLFARYEYQMRATRPNRLRRPKSRQRLSPRNIAQGL